MKKVNKITFLLAVIIAFTITQKVSAQIYATDSSSEQFTFPNGVSDWSQPLAFRLTSEKFEKKGIEAVPIEMKIKVTKKASSKLAPCIYEVEVKNLSSTQGIYFEARNDYTDPLNKYIYHKVKLKAGETQTFDIAYWIQGWDVKTKEGCMSCSWKFTYVNVKPL